MFRHSQVQGLIPFQHSLRDWLQARLDLQQIIKLTVRACKLQQLDGCMHFATLHPSLSGHLNIARTSTYFHCKAASIFSVSEPHTLNAAFHEKLIVPFTNPSLKLSSHTTSFALVLLEA